MQELLVLREGDEQRGVGARLGKTLTAWLPTSFSLTQAAGGDAQPRAGRDDDTSG